MSGAEILTMTIFLVPGKCPAEDARWHLSCLYCLSRGFLFYLWVPKERFLSPSPGRSKGGTGGVDVIRCRTRDYINNVQNVQQVRHTLTHPHSAHQVHMAIIRLITPLLI